MRAVVFIGPFASSLLFAWTATALAPTPTDTRWVILQWLAVAAASTVVLVAVERQLRRLLPLVALLRLSLPFPDHAPSRLRLALRTNSEKRLQQRIRDAREGRLGNDASEHAVVILELVAALNMHDPLTRGHSERVRAYSQMIGKQMGLDRDELDRLVWAGLLHDVGKLLVPTEVLNKPGKLTDDEFDLIKKHPEYGKGLVAPLTPWLGDSARAVWEHHERWSGGGYPRGIAGKDIALPARIVSVADTFDVITSVRSYKARTSPKEARAELARCAGTQFDPAVVKAFMEASIHRYSWMSTPAAWAAQTTFLPPAAISALVRSGLVASGLTVSGLSMPASASYDVDRQPIPAVRRVDDIELRIDEPQEPSAIDAATESSDSTAPSSGTDARAGTPPTAESGTDDATDDSDVDVLVVFEMTSSQRPMDMTGPSTPATNIVDPTPSTPSTTPDTTTATTRTPSPGTAAPTVSPITMPPNTMPPNTMPPNTMLPATTPATTAPVTMPPPTSPVTMPPVITTPHITTPAVTVPSISVPVVTTPLIALPPVTLPPVTLPPVAPPPITMPPATLPPVVTVVPVVDDVLPPAGEPVLTVPRLLGR